MVKKQEDNKEYKVDKCIMTSTSYIFLEHFSDFLVVC